MAIYHLSAKTGTRAGGQSARAKFDYLARRGKYARKEDKLTHLASGNMPAWAEVRPSSYWRSADQHERANARLYKELDVALPNELTHEQRVELAEAFVRTIARVPAGPLPFTLALHEGKPKVDGEPANPHLHVAISERVNDGHDRTRDTWFKRAAVVSKGKAAEDGGAPKTDELKPKEWLEKTRELWATMCNEALARAGHDVRIDHRSLEDQGIDRAPQVHLGPAAFGYERRTGQDSRRRAEAEQRQADDQVAAKGVRKLIEQAEAEAAQARQHALRMRQAASELEIEEARQIRRAAETAERAARLVLGERTRTRAEAVPTWQESPFGFDLFDPLPFPDTRPSPGPYKAKRLESGVVLHLRMPDDRLAFVERQDRIRMSATDANNPESVAEALQVAAAKWGEIRIQGGAEFRRLAIDQAVQLGLHRQLTALTADDLVHLATKHAIHLNR